MSLAATPKAFSASVTLVIASLLRRVAPSADAAIVLTPAVKRASSGRVSERPVDDTDSHVSPCSTTLGSAGLSPHAPTPRHGHNLKNRERIFFPPPMIPTPL